MCTAPAPHAPFFADQMTRDAAVPLHHVASPSLPGHPLASREPTSVPSLPTVKSHRQNAPTRIISARLNTHSTHTCKLLAPLHSGLARCMNGSDKYMHMYMTCALQKVDRAPLPSRTLGIAPTLLPPTTAVPPTTAHSSTLPQRPSLSAVIIQGKGLVLPIN